MEVLEKEELIAKEVRESLTKEEAMAISTEFNKFKANADLNAKVAYRLTRLGDKSTSLAKSVNKIRNDKQAKGNSEEAELHKQFAVATAEEEKITINEKIVKIRRDFSEDMQALLDTDSEIEISSFKFNL